jgi:amino acid transporter
LRRRLTLFDVLCLGVNATVGSGVFFLPDDMYREMGGWSPLAYVLCALLLLPVALCFAELGGRYESSGAAYLYARDAFGTRLGFLVGWFCWVETLIAWAANAVGLAGLAGVESPVLRHALAAGSVLVLGAVNFVGIKPGAWLVNVLTCGKLVAILAFLVAAMGALDPSRLGGHLPQGAAGVGQGIYLALFPLQGFEVVPVPAGETANPRRSIPAATAGTLILSALLFVAIQTALVASYPQIGASTEADQPLVDGAAFLWPWLGTVVLIGSIVSLVGFNAGNALGGPRFAYAIAGDRMLPAAFARVHSRFGTPHVAIVATTVLTAILASCLDYRQLIGMSNLTIGLQYFATCVAVPILRRKQGETGHYWRVPGGIAVALLGALGTVALLGYSFWAEWDHPSGRRQYELLFALGAAVVGLVVARFSGK